MNKPEYKFLANKSSFELNKIAKAAKALSYLLIAVEPTYEKAIEAGIKDLTFRTEHLVIPSFENETTITMENGNIWKCIGHKYKIISKRVIQYGFIEFVPQQGL